MKFVLLIKPKSLSMSTLITKKLLRRIQNKDYGDHHVFRRRMRSNMGGNIFLKEGTRVFQDRMSNIGEKRVYEESPFGGSYTFTELLIFNVYYG